jgi:glycosyltransferase involved in cell wall biosynthesis
MTRPGLLHVFPSFAVGGQQTRFATIANRLGGAFRHRVVSLDGRDAALKLLDPELDVALLPALPSNGGRLRRIAQCFGGVDAEILVTYNWGAIEWAIANRMLYHWPHLHFEDGFGPEEADRQKSRRVLARSLVLRRSQVVVPARNLVTIASARWHLRPERVHYIPNGIDATRFDGMPADGSPFFTRLSDHCTIGSFSPLRAEKNIGRLLSAFSQIVASGLPVRLVICGDGPERGRLSELAAALGIAGRVAFTGHVPRPEAVMGAFDLLAMTSDTEQMPYAVLEAMAARLPVVATDVGDIAAMVAPENRPFIVPRDDRAQLVAALRRLCLEPETRRRIGQRNRERVESAFTIAQMADAVHRLLDAANATRDCAPTRR